MTDSLTLKYSLEEIATLSILIYLNLAIVLFAGLYNAADIFLFNLLLIILVSAIAWAHGTYGGRSLTFIRDWYILPLLFMIYIEHAHLISLVNPHDVDSLLILLDRHLFFGHNPTLLMEKITWPFLTEILQIIYASFYFLPLTLCILAYRQDRLTFHIVAATILIGFYVSFIGYYLTPALGPRFTLQHDNPLTGIISFGALRSMLDTLEGVMRDCCPSGHAMISLLTVLLAYRYKKKFFIPAFIWTLLIIYSTVYLRYHYVVDLIAGMVLVGIYVLVVPVVERYLISHIQI